MGCEPTIPAFERAETVYVLDCATTVIGVVELMREQGLSEENGQQVER
jgi:hypothetical protein